MLSSPLLACPGTIHYLVTGLHAYTLAAWIEYYNEMLAGHLRIVPYGQLFGRVSVGTFIFSDIERLSPKATARASCAWDRLQTAGCRLLNHPTQSMRRYELQQALDNDFRVFRPSDAIQDLRFPVFLRDENEHTGSLTPLLYTPVELDRARAHYPEALLVEFLDTSDGEGIYRKYSATRIGDAIIPRHLLSSRNWLLKEPDLVDQHLLDEEADFIRINPHECELRRIFDLAHIEYGRIDYSLKDGRLQVWEINTNPHMATPQTSKHMERQRIHAQVGEVINETLMALALDPLPARGPTINLGFRRMPIW